MREESKLTPPGKTGGDHVHLGARAIISTIPGVGGPALEIFNAVISPPLEKRRNDWMESVGSALEELLRKDNHLVDRLRLDAGFQSVLLQATWAAVRNHHTEKLMVLRMAVQNSAIRSNDIQLLFVRFIDELTPTHLQVMSFFVKHEKEIAYLESYQKAVEVFGSIRDQKIDAFFFKMVCDDLKARGLVRISQDIVDLPGVYSESRILSEETSKDPRIVVTDFGRGFVDFVLTSHLEDRG